MTQLYLTRFRGGRATVRLSANVASAAGERLLTPTYGHAFRRSPDALRFAGCNNAAGKGKSVLVRAILPPNGDRRGNPPAKCLDIAYARQTSANKRRVGVWRWFSTVALPSAPSTISSGTNTRVLYNNAGVVGGMLAFNHWHVSTW